jgi:trehalose 6-phosphate synthase/phosphatase
MAQKFDKEGAEIAESLRPLLPDRQESVYPGLHPSLTNVPVTPGIHLNEYEGEGNPSEPSYFAHDINKVRSAMAQSPTDAASGARSNREILRRMSLTTGLQRRDSLLDIDPRAANPSLSLSGGIISATFCIPHSLQYRKGADWVSTFFSICRAYLIRILGPQQPPWYIRPLRLVCLPLLR